MAGLMRDHNARPKRVQDYATGLLEALEGGPDEDEDSAGGLMGRFKGFLRK